jgi:ketosteroid isomerase-like protein
MTDPHRRLSYEASCRELVRWKSDPECVWLSDCPSQALQQSLKDLDRAYRNFASGRTGAPRFKKRGRHDNFRLPQGCKLEAHKGIGTVGIDLGMTRFATLFDGTKEVVIKSPAPDPRLISGLRRAERRLSRRGKFGKNWHKARASVQGIHARITNQRLDRVHKLTARISKNHAVVCLEKLQIGNMTMATARVLTLDFLSGLQELSCHSALNVGDLQGLPTHRPLRRPTDALAK